MAVTANAYPKMLTSTFNKEVDWDSDTIKCALSNSAYTYAVTHKYFDASPFNAAFTELSTAGGYTAGGVTMGSVTYNDTTQTWFLDMADATWTGSGSGFSAQYAVVYDSTPGAGLKTLLMYVNFGGTNTVTAGGTFTLQWNAGGLFSVVVA